MLKNKQIKVGLVQIGDKYGEQYYLPYSIVLLSSYAQKNLKSTEDFVFLLPIYKRTNILDAVEKLLSADIVFFSSYIWNYRISLEIAKYLKSKRKDIVIVFGGPQIPGSPKLMECFLRKHSFVDIACYGEGEITFLEILENIHQRTWEHVSSIGFLGKDNEFMYTARSGSIEDINVIPSPYIERNFESLIKAFPREKWSALIETNRGCPYSCSFCYWGNNAQNEVRIYEQRRVFDELDWISKNRIQFVFCCDANFGLLKRDIEIVEKIINNKKQFGYPLSFSIQNTKNSTEKIFMIQKKLNDSGLQKGVNLALQSLNEDTLRAINRNNISKDDYECLQRMFSKDGIPTFSDVIIGLPLETYDSFVEGVCNIIERGQYNRIQFINLTMLENTALSESKYIEKYGLVTQKTQLISHHTNIENISSVKEMQDLVVATNSMTREQWRAARIFSWTISLLYFNKLLQIPFVLLNKIYSVSCRNLIGIFMRKNSEYPEIGKIIDFFIEKAESIQNGDCEYTASKEWLNIWWPADEYVFIKLCFYDCLPAFYKEAKDAVQRFCEESNVDIPKEVLTDAFKLNEAMIKLPFIEKDLRISLNYNIFDVYQGICESKKVSLRKGLFDYVVNRTNSKWGKWEDWFRDVVWYGSKRGAYLYACSSLEDSNLFEKINLI